MGACAAMLPISPLLSKSLKAKVIKLNRGVGNYERITRRRLHRYEAQQTGPG
ncbi:hypothetical protein FRC12_015578, partial [Ceratobasidium sp. 428]